MRDSRTVSGGFRTFIVVWAGQLVSLVGSALTGFALAVWVFQETGSATRLALVLLSTILPGIVLGPLAGALVDRWDRRWAMILSDSGAAVGTLIIGTSGWVALTSMATSVGAKSGPAAPP